MIAWGLAIACSALAVELLARLGVAARMRRLGVAYGKPLRVVSSRRISDHWKERILPVYALGIFTSSMTIFGIVLLALVPFALAALAARPLAGLDFVAFLASPKGLLGTTALAMGYAWARAAMGRARGRDTGSDNGAEPRGSGYGPADRLLHRVALGSTAIAEVSFMVDQAMAGRTDVEAVKGRRHVFVSGLARAGTTALMRLFYATGEFGSLTYRDMPFPLAPHLWGLMRGLSHKEAVATERAHGDGMIVDEDSPEALEEVFWRTFEADSYIRPDRLLPMKASRETILEFRRYVAAILAHKGARRYLSKNNNNVLRLPSIREAFPEALILVPFRDPVEQALSLHAQHARFTEIHARDGFAGMYMGWLVHHEFGSDHRPFDLGGAASASSPGGPEYWLGQWINAYRHLLSLDPGLGLVFVEYEALCDDAETVWAGLAARAGLPEALPPGFELRKARPRGGSWSGGHMLAEAREVQAELKEQGARVVLHAV